MRLSRYTRSREKNGVVAIFHELHPAPVYVVPKNWRLLQSGEVAAVSAGLQSELLEAKLLVVSEEEDEAEFSKASEALLKKFSRPSILYLMLAQGCNCSCGYCPVPDIAKRYGETLLSAEDACAGIDLWAAHVQRAYDADAEYYVIFYGGEPLLNKPVFKAALGYVRHLTEQGKLPPKNVHLLLATNGTLLDEEMADLCAQFGVEVALGLDGPEEVNDVSRVFVGGEGTSQTILQAIDLLSKRNIPTYASVTITPGNIKDLRNFAEFFRNLGIVGFGFNFLKGKKAMQFLGVSDLQDYYQEASRQVIACSRAWGNPETEYQMSKKHRAFARKDFFPVDCTCYGNQLVIQADGRIANCPFSRSDLPNVREVASSFAISETEVVALWRKRLPLFAKEYQDCDAKSLSGGGCASGSKDLTGDVLAVDNGMKIFAEEALNELIWHPLSNSQVF